VAGVFAKSVSKSIAHPLQVKICRGLFRNKARPASRGLSGGDG